ncbi:MAG TPA: carbonic anhydrase [Pyrinomonadaceae bacterium]|jgi:Carbonic anhydrase|nr:carbonic anhydrase [Pyrinomonadaceae bacterium]
MTIKRSFNIGIAVLLFSSLVILAPGSKSADKVTADSVLAELRAGNAHHVAHRYQHPHETAERQRELASGQSPHAEILSCADSRVPPELIFDQGLGDLFIIRVAGNVVSDTELGSLEYGAEHLHVPLLVVLGHQHCGAVTAAVEGGEAEGHIAALVNLLRPAVEKTRGMPGDHVENAVTANVEMVVKQLRASAPVLAKLVSEGKLKVVGAVYSLDTGKVTWLPDTL